MSEKAHRLQMMQHQLARLERWLTRLMKRSERLSRWRLLFFIGALALGGAAFLQWGPVVWLWTTAVLLLPFVVTVAIHGRVETAVAQFTLWQEIKRGHVARMTLNWHQLPPAHDFAVPAEHPFAVDIDLVGEYSLHRLLDTAVSSKGSFRLYDWLQNRKPEAEAVLSRQEVVKELASQTRFRERLTLQGGLAKESKQGLWVEEELLSWVRAGRSAPSLQKLLLGLSGLAIFNWLLFAGYQIWDWPPFWIGTLLLYGFLFILLGYRRSATLFSDVLFLTDRLRVLNRVFSFLENWQFKQMPNLERLCRPFWAKGSCPSEHIREIQRVVTGVGLRQNWLLGFVLNALVPWDIYFAFRLEQCRARLRDHLPHWLDVWYEIEAASSLATFFYLNPGELVWPTLLNAPEAPQIWASDLGHPLIPSSQRVGNDLRLDTKQAIYLITGSNMAGKSSFLRTIGVNLALAYAGGPVVASTFKTSWLRLFATIRVVDSLNDGFSFFYAEVRRLSQLLQALQDDEQERPLLFLIDEIFRGTNNRERLIGSRAYIRALAQSGGLGAIATHDLELVQLADTTTKLVNVHFRDEVIDGRMVFDYKLHQGPCPTTNALKIMQLAGLPIGSKTLPA